MFGVPVLLLTLDGAVGRVPAAVVHGLLLTVVALGRTKETRSPPRQDPPYQAFSPPMEAPAHAEQRFSLIYPWGIQSQEGIFPQVKQQSLVKSAQGSGLTFFSHTAQEPSFLLCLYNTSLIYGLKAAINQQALLAWTGSVKAWKLAFLRLLSKPDMSRGCRGRSFWATKISKVTTTTSPEKRITRYQLQPISGRLAGQLLPPGVADGQTALPSRDKKTSCYISDTEKSKKVHFPPSLPESREGLLYTGWLWGLLSPVMPARTAQNPWKKEMLHSPWFLQKYSALGSAAAKRISTPEHTECPQFSGRATCKITLWPLRN